MGQAPVASKSIITEGRTEKVAYDKDGVVEYFGFALPGTALTDSKWKILRITTTGTDWVLDWADGDASYDNKWSSRTTLTYE